MSANEKNTVGTPLLPIGYKCIEPVLNFAVKFSISACMVCNLNISLTSFSSGANHTIN